MALRVAAGALVVVVGGAAGWGTLDALDFVPGVLTIQPVGAGAEPFPQAPGAQVLPEVVTPDVLLDPEAPMPDPARVQALSEGLVADPRLGTSTTLVVADVLTGVTLADVGGELPQTPASTAKLLTAIAATSVLGPDTRLATTAVLDAGRVVLVGGGDVMLAEGAGDPTAVDGHAGLADLADLVVEALHQRGIDSVSVAVDDSLFTGPSVSPLWAADDVSAGYVSAITPIAVHLAKLDPSAMYGSRYPDPSIHAAATFSDLLVDRGVTVTGDPVRATAGDAAEELGRVVSASIADIVEMTDHLSENTLAEVLGRLVAIESGRPGSFDGAADAVLASVAFEGVVVAGGSLSDCSGLAAGSEISAATLADAIGLTATDPALVAVARDLPVGALNGTVADRFIGGEAAGLVRAKTGSLPGVTSLTGTILTVDGRLLAFAVMADETGATGQWSPRAAIDEWVADLASCGCSADGP